MTIGATNTAARAFVRSLNLVLKSARLYGFNHTRTARQFEVAWNELRAALPADGESTFLLGVSSNQLLIDGVPLKATPAERSFAQTLAAAGLASILFTPRVTVDEFARFVRAYAVSGGKPAALADQLKASLGESHTSGIRINLVRFVAEDSSLGEARVAAEIVARTLGGDADQVRDWMNNPERLLQLIAAAQGAEGGAPSFGAAGEGEASSGEAADTGLGSGDPGGGNPGSGDLGSGGSALGGSSSGAGASAGEGPGGTSSAGSGSAGAGSGGAGLGDSGAGRAGPGGSGSGGSVPGRGLGILGMPGGGWGPRMVAVTPGRPSVLLQEDDVLQLLRLLTGIGRFCCQPGTTAHPEQIQQQLASLPVASQQTLRQALVALASKAAHERPDAPMLLTLAEHLAIRFALERYESGKVRVNAVRQMLDRMAREIESLRKILATHEETISRAGLQAESHVEILDRQFWAAVPESGKRSVLLSTDAWCIPARNVQQYVQELLRRGETDAATSVLLRYATCIASPEVEARRRTAIGLSGLAELYAQVGERALPAALREVGEQVGREAEPELQSPMNAAFVRLCQEATTRHHYPGVQQAMLTLELLEQDRPALAQTLRPRVGVENRLPEFVEEALRVPRVPDALVEVLRRVPGAAAEQLGVRLIRCMRTRERERLIELVQALGAEGIHHLRQTLRFKPAAEAVSTIGVLSRLDVAGLEDALPTLLSNWTRVYQDAMVRQLAYAGAAERGRLLLQLLDLLEPLIAPLAMDEIGMSGDLTNVARLIRLAEGELPQSASPYLRVKAIEALGRLRATGAADVLRAIVETKQYWRWTHPREVRVVAAQALEGIDPEWAQDFLPRSGLDAAELALGPLPAAPDSPRLRQRVYPRIRLLRPVAAIISTAQDHYLVSARVLGLGGGLAPSEKRPTTNTEGRLKIQSGMRPLTATVLMRGAGAHQIAFEVVDIELEERTKLRRLLINLGSTSAIVQSARVAKGQLVAE